MTHRLFIGASASADAAPTYPLEAWDALLSAMDRGDHEAVIRITTGTAPTMIPTAQLRDVKPSPPKTMAEAAAAYWAKRGKAPKATAATTRDGSEAVEELSRFAADRFARQEEQP